MPIVPTLSDFQVSTVAGPCLVVLKRSHFGSRPFGVLISETSLLAGVLLFKIIEVF